LPGWSLTSATSVPIFPVRDTTVFGTGLATVGFTGITTRGGATDAVFKSPPIFLEGSPNAALPSVTGIGGKLETAVSADGPFCLTMTVGVSLATISCFLFPTPSLFAVGCSLFPVFPWISMISR
jgi:hypothetical protein